MTAFTRKANKTIFTHYNSRVFHSPISICAGIAAIYQLE